MNLTLSSSQSCDCCPAFLTANLAPTVIRMICPSIGSGVIIREMLLIVTKCAHNVQTPQAQLPSHFGVLESGGTPRPVKSSFTD